jgi:fructokinase
VSLKATTKNKPLVLGVGELLWDLLPSGKQLGGATANFAYHAHALGAEALTVSRVGRDALGREILERLGSLGLRTDGISTDASAPTGTVDVALDPQGKPTFTIHENVAWDSLEASPEILAEAAQASAICFGTLAQRNPLTRAAIRAVLKAAPVGTLRIFDINLRQRFWSPELILESLAVANVLKLNDEELTVVAGLFGLSGNESDQLRQLAAQFQLKVVALTKGANGSVLLLDGELVSRPGSKLNVVDTVGAGDSYTAAMTIGLLGRQCPARILECAHRLADYVCTQPGAMPPLPPLLIESLAAV